MLKIEDVTNPEYRDPLGRKAVSLSIVPADDNSLERELFFKLQGFMEDRGALLGTGGRQGEIRMIIVL